MTVAMTTLVGRHGVVYRPPCDATSTKAFSVGTRPLQLFIGQFSLVFKNTTIVFVKHQTRTKWRRTWSPLVVVL